VEYILGQKRFVLSTRWGLNISCNGADPEDYRRMRSAWLLKRKTGRNEEMLIIQFDFNFLPKAEQANSYTI